MTADQLPLGNVTLIDGDQYEVVDEEEMADLDKGIPLCRPGAFDLAKADQILSAV